MGPVTEPRLEPWKQQNSLPHPFPYMYSHTPLQASWNQKLQSHHILLKTLMRKSFSRDHWILTTYCPAAEGWKGRKQGGGHLREEENRYLPCWMSLYYNCHRFFFLKFLCGMKNLLGKNSLLVRKQIKESLITNFLGCLLTETPRSQKHLVDKQGVMRH